MYTCILHTFIWLYVKRHHQDLCNSSQILNSWAPFMLIEGRGPRTLTEQSGGCDRIYVLNQRFTIRIMSSPTNYSNISLNIYYQHNDTWYFIECLLLSPHGKKERTLSVTHLYLQFFIICWTFTARVIIFLTIGSLPVRPYLLQPLSRL